MSLLLYYKYLCDWSIYKCTCLYTVVMPPISMYTDVLLVINYRVVDVLVVHIQILYLQHCHLMLNSPAIRWHLRFYFFFLNSAILHSCILATAVYIYWYLPLILDINQLSLLVLSVGMHLGILYIFNPPFLYLGDEHVSWSACFSQMACICHFIFMSCPEPPMGISSVDSFPVWSGGSLIIFQLLRCRNLVLNMIFSYLRGRLWGCKLRRHPYSPCMPHMFVHPLIHPYSPCTSVCPHTPCTSVCPPYTICISVHPICLEIFWGVSVHMSGISVSVSTSICLSVNKSHVSCTPSLWLLPYWTGWLWMSAILLAVPFFVAFIMSQASTTLATNTTPPVTVVSSGMSSLFSIVTMVPSLMGLPATSGQHEVVLPPPLTPRHSGGAVGLATVLQQQPPSQMPLQAYANYAMGPPQVGFFFRVEPPTILYFYMFGVCSGVCFLLSGAMLDAIFTYGGSTIGVCTISILWNLLMAGICATWQWSSAHTRYAQSGCSLHYFE